MRLILSVFFGVVSTITMFANSPKEPRKDVDTIVIPAHLKAGSNHFPESMLTFRDTISLPDRSVFVDVVPIYPDSFHSKLISKMNLDIDVEYNRYVQTFIDVYCVKKRNIGRVVAGKFPYYEQAFEQILVENGLPKNLKYLGIVESGINPDAVSRSGATGIWQFMYGTGKYLKMNISYFRDDRKDIYASTRAAAKYLKYLYNRFDDWLLAIAAYNCGPGNMSKAIRKSGGKKTFWEVRKFLPRETRNYIPAFLAVNYMMENMDVLNIIPFEPMTFHYPMNDRSVDEVMVHQKMTFSSIAKVLDIPMEQLSFMNPGIKKSLIPFSTKGYNLKLPCDKIPEFNEKLGEILREEAEYSAMMGEHYFYDRDRIIYKIRSGDNLSVIAKRFDCKVSELMEWNNLTNSNIYINQKLVVFHGPVTAPNKNHSKDRVKNTKSTGGFVYYTIARGDTLWSISKRFPGSSIEKIKQANSIYNVNNLKPGKVLKIVTS